jgi:c-di-GMP-binding flagellar brake protein YcgR
MNEALFLAQIYWKRGDDKLSTIAVIIIGVVILFVVVFTILKNGIGEFGGLSGNTTAAFKKGAFRRAARSVGIQEEEIRFLEVYGKALDITNPEFVFRNQARLDVFFKDVYRAIDKNSESESESDERKALLFTVRERISAANAAGQSVSSTRQLGRNTPITFIAPGEESYPSVIVAIEPGGIAVEPARDPYNEPKRFKNGTKFTCYFYAKGHQGYQFSSKVVGWERIGLKEVMVISHSDAVSALPARKHTRREMHIPCTFYRVAVSQKDVRGKSQSNARVENLPFPGTIVDISAGGVGIQSANALPAGDFLKIEFNPGAGTEAAFGKVLRMEKLRGGGIMHAQFVKISRRTLNAILSSVHGYTE